MKTKLVLASALLAMTCAVKAETMSFTSTFKAEDVTLAPAGNGETLIDWADGSLGASAPGKPWIPTKTITFRLPAGFAYVSHEVEVGETVLLASDVVPIPEQQPVPTGAEAQEPTPRDAAAYASAAAYPSLRGRFVSKGSMRGVTLVSFELAPIWYVATEKKLYLASSITVRVKAEPQPMPTGPAASSFPASALFENSVNSLVVNPETESAPLQIAASAAKGGSGAEYLVITGPGLTDGAQMLADFRGEFNGVGTKVVTTDEIATSYSGSDLQEKIRACITWYVANKGTTTVVLAGDDTVIPPRRVKMILDNGYSDTGPTDLYYSDLTGTYESSESGFIYQTSSLMGYSGIDLNPDVVVGRIPVRTGTQLCDYVRKVIAYERTTTADSDIVRKTMIGGFTLESNLTRVGDSGNDWRDSKQGSTSFAVASETFQDGMTEYLDIPGGGVLSDAEVHMRRLHKPYALAYNPYFRTSFFFGKTTSWDRESRGDHVQSFDTFTAALSRGYHQCLIEAHGNYALWGQGPTGNGAFFNADYAQLLSNRVDFVYTTACYTGGFDMAEPSLSEGFLRSPGGALGYIGCSRYGWNYKMCAYGTTSGTSDWCLAGKLRGQSLLFAVEFQKRIYGLDGKGNSFERDTTLGAAFMNHKAAFASKWTDLYNLWLTFYINLQGDPLLTYHLPPSETGTAAESAESGLVTLLRDRPVAVGANSATVRLAADEIVLGKTAAVSLEYSTSPEFASVTTVAVGNFTQQTETEKTITGLSPATTYYVRAKSVIGETHMSPFALSFTTLPANAVGGTVLDAGGTPVASVTVRAKDGSGAVVGTTQTGADGAYALALSAGWTGTVEAVAPQGFAASAAASVTIPSGGSATADFSLTKVVYVNGRASGKNDGTSWADAFTTLHAALKTAAAGDQVWVAEGVYTPEEIAAYGRDCHFAPASGVFVYGGFAGNETSLSARDWIAHPTVLSGDIGTKGNASDNCLHLIRYAAGALFDGFGLTGANLDDISNISQIYSTYGAIVGTPESNPSAKVVGDPYPQFGENPGSTSGPIFFDHCAVTNNSATAGSYDGANLVGNGIKATFRNCLIAHNTVNNASRNGMMDNTLLDNCTVTANSTVVAPFSSARIRNTIVVGNTQSSSCGVKTSVESGTDGNAGRQRVVLAWIAKASGGSDRFMSESFYCMSSTTGLDIPSDAWYPADPGWTTKDGFAYALGEKSGAAEKGKVLEWMTEDTLDYLGNPRVHGTVPDLGCCEAVADSGEGDDDDDDEEIVRPADEIVAGYTAAQINAMDGDALMPSNAVFAGTSFDLPYRQHTPTVADGVKYPLVIFLHGVGERGNNTGSQRKDCLPICRYAMKHGDAYVIAPQCPAGELYANTWAGVDWNVCPMTRNADPTPQLKAVKELIESLLADTGNYAIDPTRVYVTGVSMGGFGTWDLVPRLAAGTVTAMMPCCGGADTSLAASYDGVAIRFFHGASDDVVTPQFSRNMDAALTSAGVEHDYIEYSGVGHTDCYNTNHGYSDANLAWLFGHITGEEYVAPEEPEPQESDSIWSAVPTKGDGSSVRKDGTLKYAYAYSTGVTVNDVIFSGVGSLPSADIEVSPGFNANHTGFHAKDAFGSGIPGDPSADAVKTLIKDAWYNSSGSQYMTVTFKGLEPGKTYLAQLFVCDNRVLSGGSDIRGNFRLIAPERDGSYGPTFVHFGAMDAEDLTWAFGGSFVGVFEATDTSYQVKFNCDPNRACQLNAVQVRELGDDPVIGTPTIGSASVSVSGTTATFSLTDVAMGDNAEYYGVYLAYGPQGGTMPAASQVMLVQTEASVSYDLVDLASGTYDYSIYVRNNGNVDSLAKTGSFTISGGSDPDPVDPPFGPGGSYEATGAEEIADGDYVIYRWTDPAHAGTLTLSGSATVDYLVVGGGGAGGFCRGGGGGGGGVVYKTAQTLGAGTYTITVGAGGTPDTWEVHSGDSCYKYSGASTEGTDGGSSSIASAAATVCEALGGGGGGTFITGQDSAFAEYGSSGAGRTGANAGGSANKQPSVTAFEGGFAGGAAWSGGDAASGGGGGAGAVGAAATSNSASGNGGDGCSCAITGEDVVYGGGGGAGVYNGTAGAGGAGGGGNGGKGDGGGANTGMSAGVDGLGGGGGGASGGGNKWMACGGAKGGSGVVIIRLPRMTGDDPEPSINEQAAELAPGEWLVCPLTGKSGDIVTCGELVTKSSKALTYAPHAITGDDSVSGVSFLENAITFFDDKMSLDLWSNYKMDEDSLGDCGLAGAYGKLIANGWGGQAGSGCANPADAVRKLKLNGLESGKTYLIQGFVHDGTHPTRKLSVGSGTITYGAESSEDEWYYGGTFVHVFTVSDGTYEFDLDYTAGQALVNALQLREIETVTPPPAHEHVWSDWVTNTPPTATTPGQRTRTCIAEGCTVPPATEVEEIPATGGGDEPVDPPQDGPGSIVEAAAVLAPGYWYAAPLTGEPADIVTNGTMATTTVAGKGAKSLSGAKSYGTVNGVDFGGSWSGDNAMMSSPHNVSQGKDFGTSATCGVEGKYGEILKNAFDSKNNDGPCTFAFSGLDPAKTYLVQYVIHSTDDGHTAEVMGLNGLQSVRLGAMSADDDWYYGATLIHVFKPAEDGTYSLVIDYRKNGDAANAIVNAFQVREVEEREAPGATTGWTSKPMSVSGDGLGAAFSEEGTQVFAFMPDDGDPGTTATNLYPCNIRVNLLNSLTDTVTKLHDATQKEWSWTQDGDHPWNGVFNDGRQPVDFLAVEPALSRNAQCETVSGASDDFNCMLKRAFINYNGEKTMTVTFKNLKVGSSYVAELYVHHGFNGDRKSVTAPDGIAKAYYGGEGDWRYGGILSGRFVATGTEQSFVFTFSTSSALQINAIQLRELGGVTPPEPPEPRRGFLLIVK